MIRLGLMGSQGKMGRRVLDLVQSDQYKSKIKVHQTPGRGDSLQELNTCDVLIDFSSPQMVLDVLAAGVKTPILIGSTGWKTEELKSLENYALQASLFFVPNFSMGVAIVRSLLRELKKTGAFGRYSIRMKEEHHRHKKDSPSGTALSLVKELPQGCPIESIREGEIIGTHSVFLESVFERIEIRHEALSRDLFASGAIESAITLAASSRKFSGKVFGLDDLI